MKTILVVVAFVAMGCAISMQHFRLARTQASLARYETSLIPTALQPNQFRVIARIAIQTDHVKMITYRIESADQHFATIESNGGSNGGRSTYDPKTDLHFTEAVFLIDHVKSMNALKVLPKVSGAQGYSVAFVPDDFSLDSVFTLHDLEPVYLRDASVELLVLNGRSYALTLKP